MKLDFLKKTPLNSLSLSLYYYFDKLNCIPDGILMDIFISIFTHWETVNPIDEPEIEFPTLQMKQSLRRYLEGKINE